MAEYITLDDSSGPKFKVYRFGKFSISTMEMKHLFVALFMITLTLMFFRPDFITRYGYVTTALIFLVVVGLGFLLHEFAHKLVAQHYGYLSEFRGDFLMMLLALLVAIVSPIVFLAPGAVMIMGRPSVKRNGIISVAGPIVNLVLAVIFFGLSFIFTQGITGVIMSLGVIINAFLGIFNMLPFWVLDGKKVLAWSKPVYFSVMGLLILMYLLGLNVF